MDNVIDQSCDFDALMAEVTELKNRMYKIEELLAKIEENTRYLYEINTSLTTIRDRQ